MLTVVFDVNVLVSSLIVKGKPRELWQKAKDNEFTLVYSKEILLDLVRVLKRPKFEKYLANADIRLFLYDIRVTGKQIPLQSKFSVVAEDPDDDLIIRTAYDAKADFVVSGDRHLLLLEEFEGIRIVTVDQMLDILSGK